VEEGSTLEKSEKKDQEGESVHRLRRKKRKEKLRGKEAFFEKAEERETVAAGNWGREEKKRKKTLTSRRIRSVNGKTQKVKSSRNLLDEGGAMCQQRG